MISSLVKRVVSNAKSFAACSAAVLLVSGCGGGGGSGSNDDKISAQPAPQTFNGLVLTLYVGGVELTFIRAEGDALTAGETGAVTMKEKPATFIGTDSTGAPVSRFPSGSISGARYTYFRTSPEAGVLIITGAGSGIYEGPPPNGFVSYFQNPTFTRTYNLLFGTDGASISGVSVNDTSATPGEVDPFPGILWTSATLRVFPAGQVPVGWSLASSQGVPLRKFYPDSVSQQRLEITPTALAAAPEGYQFLNSTFTRYSTMVGDFLEEGVGNKDAVPTFTLVNFDYQPDPATLNRARIRIYEGAKPVITYNLTFLDLEKGTYVREDGSTGTFEFPFLDN